MGIGGHSQAIIGIFKVKMKQWEVCKIPRSWSRREYHQLLRDLLTLTSPFLEAGCWEGGPCSERMNWCKWRWDMRSEGRGSGFSLKLMATPVHEGMVGCACGPHPAPRQGQSNPKETNISGPPRPALCQQQHYLEERHFAHALCTHRPWYWMNLQLCFVPCTYPWFSAYLNRLHCVPGYSLHVCGILIPLFSLGRVVLVIAHDR